MLGAPLPLQPPAGTGRVLAAPAAALTTQIAVTPLTTSLLPERPVPEQNVATRPVEPAERSDRAEKTAYLLRAAADADDTERRLLLDEVVLLNRGVAHAIASRYRSRGVAEEDLQQVACLALVKAANGYDPEAGHDFLSYAVPTIRGEVKRYFRDHGWAVRPTRRIQELQSRISMAENDLSFALGRSPRISELAEHLDECIEDITEALATDGCFTPASLDRPVGHEDESATLGDLLGGEDGDRDALEARVILGPVVRRLGDRDRRILMLRFFKGWTQQEIAQDIGVTQMQVSRLLSRILRDLREQLSDAGA
jgi:RNA polymerase sigma-B factor